MLKKAKLDVLDDFSAVEVEPTAEAFSGDVSDADETTEGRWARNKILLIAAPAFIVFIVITGILWFFLASKISHQREVKVVVPPPSVAAPPIQTVAPSLTTAGEEEKAQVAFFNDFVINLKDNAGKSRILMLDITLEVKGDAQVDEEINKSAIRNMIYNMAKSKNAVAMKSMEERKKLKMELSAELDKMFGEGFVQSVYFTKFVIL